jgi:hypothetical protein
MCSWTPRTDGTGAGITIPADPQAKPFAEAMFKFLTDSACEGKTLVRPNPVWKLPGGLSEKIARDGFYLLRPELMGPVPGVECRGWRSTSAEKLVYRFI